MEELGDLENDPQKTMVWLKMKILVTLSIAKWANKDIGWCCNMFLYNKFDIDIILQRGYRVKVVVEVEW